MRELKIQLPRPHKGQRQMIDEAARFNVAECGRRFGKTVLGEDRLIEPALRGLPTGWFAPTHKILAPAWRDVTTIVKPIIRDVSKTEHRIELITGGTMEFWSVDNPDSGRGRKYARVILDEASIIRELGHVWQATIRPTLSDLKGDAYFLGTPRGLGEFHRMFTKGEKREPGWRSWRLRTIDNPYIDPAEIEDARRDLPTHVFEQEYLGIPADDGGNPFGLSAIRACVQENLAAGPPVYFGVDLAKSQDWTWVVGLDEEGREAVSVRWQSDWGQTRRRVVEILGDSPALIDSTGVGDPIVEDIRRERPAANGFKFTSQSKQQIMEGLAAAIQQQRIRLSDSNLIAELETFIYEYTKSGVRYTAPTGLHDDGVCALALAVQCMSERAGRGLMFAMSGESRVASDESRYFGGSDNE